MTPSPMKDTLRVTNRRRLRPRPPHGNGGIVGVTIISLPTPNAGDAGRPTASPRGSGGPLARDPAGHREAATSITRSRGWRRRPLKTGSPLGPGRLSGPPRTPAFGAPTAGGAMALPSGRAPARTAELVAPRAGLPAASIGAGHGNPPSAAPAISARRELGAAAIALRLSRRAQNRGAAAIPLRSRAAARAQAFTRFLSTVCRMPPFLK